MMFYPLGYPLYLETNSEAVLRAAAESWGVFGPMREAEPMRLKVVVEPGGEEATPPVYRSQDHLLTISGGKANFAVCDYTRRLGYCHLSEAAAANRPFASYYFLEAMAFHLLTQWYVAPVHGACVAKGGAGVALCGDSGAGKSSLAYACLKQGWTYVSDNESWLVRADEPPRLIGNPSRIRFRDSAVALFPELSGLVPALHANGKMSIHLRTAGQTQCESHVNFVIFLDRQSDAPGAFTRTPREAAFAKLLAGVPLYEPRIRREHERALRRLTELPVLSMRYSSPESGVACLEELV
jgi:serine kinase of HPr protein (carbohydrate metabolism regulator)